MRDVCNVYLTAVCEFFMITCSSEILEKFHLTELRFLFVRSVSNLIKTATPGFTAFVFVFLQQN